MVKLLKRNVNGYMQYQITIPSKLVRAKGWEGGKELEIVLDGKGDLKIVEK